MSSAQFNIYEILAFVGVAQCVYILVYFSFRAGHILRAALPALYFSVLALALFFDASARHLSDGFSYYFILQWGLWFSGPPLSYLLILQISSITRTPEKKHFLILFLIPVAFLISYWIGKAEISCADFANCKLFKESLQASGLIAGTISLLSIWLNTQRLSFVARQRVMGKERFWLILSLIVMNVVFLSIMFLSMITPLEDHILKLLRTVLGLGFVYLASTSLFRIYPQAVRLVDTSSNDLYKLTDKETDLAMRVEQLMNRDKVYQEPSYSRKDMARELGVSEAVLSKIFNIHYGKSFPQILNENRVEDAKRLLGQTDAPVKVIAEDVGFNSLASFNRVFKDIQGCSPSEFRKRQ